MGATVDECPARTMNGTLTIVGMPFAFDQDSLTINTNAWRLHYEPVETESPPTSLKPSSRNPMMLTLAPPMPAPM